MNVWIGFLLALVLFYALFLIFDPLANFLQRLFEFVMSDKFIPTALAILTVLAVSYIVLLGIYAPFEKASQVAREFSEQQGEVYLYHDYNFRTESLIIKTKENSWVCERADANFCRRVGGDE